MPEELEADHQDRVGRQDFDEIDSQASVESSDSLVANGVADDVTQANVGLVALHPVVRLLVAQLHVVLLSGPQHNVRIRDDAGTSWIRSAEYLWPRLK